MAKVVVTRKLPDKAEAQLTALFGAQLNRDDRPLGREDLARAMRACEVLVPTVTDRLDGALIRGAGGRLKLIANFGVGTDHIELVAARECGIAVTNTPRVLTEDTADLVTALILAAPRRLSEGERLLRAGAWTGWAPTNLMGRSLTGKMLGIVGMGRIGLAVAKRARACGMAIGYHGRHPVPGADARYFAELDELMAAADILSVNCPYGPDTHHLIDARRLRLMRKDAYLINAARGAIVDQEALIAALQTGAIAGAGLDVYPEEPAIDPRLPALPNVTLLPHLGSATIEGRTAMGVKVVDNIVAWSQGRPLPDRVA
jgi:glyoxylate reductase